MNRHTVVILAGLVLVVSSIYAQVKAKAKPQIATTRAEMTPTDPETNEPYRGFGVSNQRPVAEPSPRAQVGMLTSDPPIPIYERSDDFAIVFLSNEDYEPALGDRTDPKVYIYPSGRVWMADWSKLDENTRRFWELLREKVVPCPAVNP